ncbi:hypothetical protein [Halobacillus mangrovi]|uniref:Uncharacterized protein n=1 Tax=Halobacillus mangrovi TaxID=402384 RepID=A0A1W5ZY90_9BACI|nr:hypothetical protein [Halobacillus mangrovi]ARI78230.1 hypothetical protein HM131_15835 [Halobacillus mangrovi]
MINPNLTQIKVRTQTVSTTEEYNELQQAVKQQGGRIVETTPLRNGGISVKIELTERRPD